MLGITRRLMDYLKYRLSAGTGSGRWPGLTTIKERRAVKAAWIYIGVLSGLIRAREALRGKGGLK